MAKRTVLGLVFTAMLFVAGTEGCTLGSDTYIDEKSADSTGKDGGASSTATTTSASTTASASCRTDDFATVDLTKQTACGNGKGHCYDKTKIGGSGNMDACPDASQVCVPDEMLKADGQKLKTCNTILSTPGACFSIDAISQVATQGGSALGQDVCDAGQKCVPCGDPRNNNAPTGFCDAVGAHTNACSAAPAAGGDAGAAPAAPGCCTTGGKSAGVCIASSAVPASQKDSVPTDTCTGDNKCVPAAFVAGTPTKCSALLGNGVCMDKCFSNGMAIAGGVGLLEQLTCGATELCIPCLAVIGQGVPGCQ